MKSVKEIDYKIKGIKRVRCPKCGELGIRTNYPDGGSMMKHKCKIESLGKDTGLSVAIITKHCFFKNLNS